MSKRMGDENSINHINRTESSCLLRNLKNERELSINYTFVRNVQQFIKQPWVLLINKDPKHGTLENSTLSSLKSYPLIFKTSFLTRSEQRKVKKSRKVNDYPSFTPEFHRFTFNFVIASLIVLVTFSFNQIFPFSRWKHAKTNRFCYI